MSDDKDTPKFPTEEVELKPIRRKDANSNSNSLDLHSIDSKLEDLEYTKKTDDTEEVHEETPFLDTRATETLQVEDLARTTDIDEIELQNLNPENVAETAVDDKSKRSNAERLKKFLNSTRPARFRIVGLVMLGLVVVLLFALFIHKSLESVQYDKLALKRNSITGRLNTERTYGSGLHFIFPWNEFLFFDRTVHSISFQNLRVLTRDKLEVSVSVEMFYFINPDELGQLYRKFGNDYKPVISSVARSTFFNEGQKFTIKDYRSERDKIYKTLKAHFKEVFGKYHFNLLNIYLKSISFGKTINDLNLKRVLNDIENEKAVYTKQIALTIAETELQVVNYKNQARYTISNATATSNAAVKSSNIDYSYIMENIHSAEFNYTLNELNYKIGSNKNVLKQRLSYIYLYTLMNHKRLVIYPHDYLTQKKVFNL